MPASPTSFDSISVLKEKIRSGTTTPTQLAKQCLQQIDRFEHCAQAWVIVDQENALRTAEQCTKRLLEESSQSEIGPLFGIPIGIKDIIDVQGFPTLAGSRLRESAMERYKAEQDAPLVAALRAAGAIILGKTVTVEFACFDPSRTVNPWDPALSTIGNAENANFNPQFTAGGSSSGSASAVGLGMCVAAIGTQTGGSLVRPSSYCGICAMKPTFGSVDGHGIVPVTDVFDTPGPMARSIGDLRAIWKSLPRGTGFGPPNAKKPRPDAKCARETKTTLRLGLVRSFFLENADESMRQGTEKAMERLRIQGVTIEESRPDYSVPLESLLSAHTTIMAADAARFHQNNYPAQADLYGPCIASLLDIGLKTSATQLSEALDVLRRARRKACSLLTDFDALIMPATDTTAPKNRDTTGPKDFQAVWSCLGLPVVSFPCDVSDAGMPIALQLVGRYHDDDRLLEIAEYIEQLIRFDATPPCLRV
jgi:Asp-tRNA(Asn)/Glu-tRNA(Gln) amidotransferase A subunit family amidase